MADSNCNLRICDCYHENSSYSRGCWDCSRNENAESKTLKDNYISNRDKVDELFKYLTDEQIPTGVMVRSRPTLSSNKAWNLIWFLQEVTRCLPDTIERCDICGELYDSDSQGFRLDDQYTLNGKTLPKKYWGCYCNENCAPNVDFDLA